MALDFALPDSLQAAEPPPARDGVRLLVARQAGLAHARFTRLGEFLSAGDLVVVNTSGTYPAAVDGNRAGIPVEVHFSAQLDDGDWVVEVRPAAGVHRAGHRPAARRGDHPARRRRPDRRPAAPSRAGPAMAGPAADRRRCLFVPHPPRATHPVRVRTAPVAAIRVPDRLRPRAGQRGDAERRAAVHHTGGHRPGYPRRGAGPHRAAHRRRLRRNRASRRSRNGSVCRRRPPGWSTSPARRAGG